MTLSYISFKQNAFVCWLLDVFYKSTSNCMTSYVYFLYVWIEHNHLGTSPGSTYVYLAIVSSECYYVLHAMLCDNDDNNTDDNNNNAL